MTTTHPATTAPDHSVLETFAKGVWIDGRSQPAAQGATFDVVNPATGQVLCAVADATEADAVRALDAAAAAGPGWAATPPRRRSEVLRRCFDAVVERTEEIARLITLEMGKSLAESRAEVAYGADLLRWFSEQAVRIGGDFTANPTGPGRVLVMRQPVGPCLLITPWNLPLAMATRKVGPALAAGCTVVLKPAEQTPLTLLLLAEILHGAGLPDGVLNVVPTSAPARVADPLLADPRLREVSFTGSTEVGKALIRASAQNVLRTSMGLGGNAPFVVCADADVDAAVAGAMIAKMRNVGEACIAANRFYVHTSVMEEFTGKLVARMGAMTVELGGTAPDGPGYFYPPTVLTGVTPSSRTFSEEVFGPVAPLTPFTDDDEEALALANDTPFGLVGHVFTRDLERALWYADRLQAGMVGLNRGLVPNAAAPFGGVKQSGLGREGGATGIEEYLEIKCVAVGPE